MEAAACHPHPARGGIPWSKAWSTAWRRQFSCLAQVTHVVPADSDLSSQVLLCCVTVLLIHKNFCLLLMSVSEFCREIPSFPISFQ